jgi:peptidoglycan/LPS O-acetylase OafA/YrhL
VEGLRAVAVVIVVLYHVGMPGFPGGYVGVDVFYAISGYVITNLLLRQVGRYGRPHFAEFYARRARRILPAAGLVTLGTVLASYLWLGFIRGNEVADDARWVAVFLGNSHFASVGTNYFQSQLPPSPLLNYWSLAVEEQFYLAYPAAIALLVVLFRRVPIKTKLMVFTGGTFAISFAWSVYYTSLNSSSAYFSIWTRAWELALGGFVASSSHLWARLPSAVGAALAWVGIVAIIVGVVSFSSATLYPGWAAVVPVGGAALTILGGIKANRFGPELLLGTKLFRWVGKLSFSIYLWHWPVLTIGAQVASYPLSLVHRLVLAALSVVGATLTFYCLEDPVRRSKWLAMRPMVSIVMGLMIVGLILAVATFEIHIHQTL